jgi:predicted transposase YbfD/YdcC
VLDTVPELRGVVVTADALNCQPTPAEYLHGRGAHYLFTVKSNQPTLRQALAGLPWAQEPGLRDRQIGHGRTESRPINILDLDASPEGPAVPARRPGDQRHPPASLCRSGQAVDADGVRDHLPGPPRPRPAAAGRLDPLALDDRELPALGRDVTEGEDHSRVRTGNGPQVMAALSNTAINIIRLRGDANIAAAHRAFSYSPTDVLNALTAA